MYTDEKLLDQDQDDDDVVQTTCLAEQMYAGSSWRAKAMTVLSSGLLLTCSAKLMVDGVDQGDDASVGVGVAGAFWSLSSLSGLSRQCVDHRPVLLSLTRVCAGAWSMVAGILAGRRHGGILGRSQ